MRRRPRTASAELKNTSGGQGLQRPHQHGAAETGVPGAGPPCGQVRCSLPCRKRADRGVLALSDTFNQTGPPAPPHSGMIADTLRPGGTCDLAPCPVQAETAIRRVYDYPGEDGKAECDDPVEPKTAAGRRAESPYNARWPTHTDSIPRGAPRVTTIRPAWGAGAGSAASGGQGQTSSWRPRSPRCPYTGRRCSFGATVHWDDRHKGKYPRAERRSVAGSRESGVREVGS